MWAERPENRVERSGARSGGLRSGNGAGSGGYRIRLERGAAFFARSAPLRSAHMLWSLWAKNWTYPNFPFHFPFSPLHVASYFSNPTRVLGLLVNNICRQCTVFLKEIGLHSQLTQVELGGWLSLMIVGYCFLLSFYLIGFRFFDSLSWLLTNELWL